MMDPHELKRMRDEELAAMAAQGTDLSPAAMHVMMAQQLTRLSKLTLASSALTARLRWTSILLIVVATLMVGLAVVEWFR